MHEEMAERSRQAVVETAVYLVELVIVDMGEALEAPVPVGREEALGYLHPAAVNLISRHPVALDLLPGLDINRDPFDHPVVTTAAAAARRLGLGEELVGHLVVEGTVGLLLVVGPVEAGFAVAAGIETG